MSRVIVTTLVLAGLAVAQERFVDFPAKRIIVKDAATGIDVTTTLSPFAVAPAEVTQREYEKVTGTNPSRTKGADLPVENVSWWDAIKYCNLRSMAEGLQPCYDLTTGQCDRTRNGYRLLTDAEWTVAAGTTKNGNLGPEGTKDTRILMEHARTYGTQAAASVPANEFGLRGMFGNVWEWVQDYFDPAGGVALAADPAGPSTGMARIVRGGSYLSTTSRWAGGYRSSIEPDRRSPYTGFRVCRSLAAAPPAADAKWMQPYQQAPPAFAGQTGGLALPALTDRAAWEKQRVDLRRKWADLLGRPDIAKLPVGVRHVSRDMQPTYSGELMYLQVEPDYWEKIYLMLPTQRDPGRPLPVVIVPYYDVDAPAGRNMGGRVMTPLGTRAYAHLAVQQGFAAVAIRWFGQSYGENSAEVVANLKQRHPRVTGLGKWVWDAQRLLDYLETRPELDTKRIGMIGHSLGGKMTLYAIAMDDRIKAAVSSEPGIGLSYSNYEDFWYWGEDIKKLGTSDHNELLAIIAPRPFLLIGGDSADNDKSWHYINSARTVYSLYGAPDQIGYVNHRQGHSPTPESIRLSMEWLARFLRR